MLPPRLRHGRTLLTAHDIVLTLPEGRRLGPWSGSIARGQRIAVRVGDAGQWRALTDLLTGERRPDEGRLEEIEPVTAQTDANILATLDLNRSIAEFLNSPDAPEYVWLEQRRHVLWVLLDALGIRPDMTRIPLKLLPQDAVEKFCALRFMVSKADLLLGRDLFASSDAAIQRAMTRRWRDFTGTVIAAVPPGEALPGPCDVQWRIGEAGDFHVEENPGDIGFPPVPPG